MNKNLLKFGKKEKSDKKEIDKESAAKLIARNEAINAARRLLSSPQFSAYVEILKQEERLKIEVILNYEEQDPIKYAFRMKELVTEIKMARIMLNMVKTDSALGETTI